MILEEILKEWNRNTDRMIELEKLLNDKTVVIFERKPGNIISGKDDNGNTFRITIDREGLYQLELDEKNQIAMVLKLNTIEEVIERFYFSQKN